MPPTPNSRPDPGKHRVLLAPDSFKGTSTAHQVAAALATGVRQAGAVPDLCPLADGGEGTLAVLHDHLAGQLVTAPVRDPLGRTVRASYLRIDAETAVTESALASGLGLTAGESGFDERASTYGTGQQLAAASAGARRIILTAGGTAATDGGTGALAAIDAGGGLRGAHIDVLCDVTVPFEKAAAVFGPQKGAAPAQVAVLTERLQHTAAQLRKDPRGVPRTGCAGGLSQPRRLSSPVPTT
jgi:glycerate 2-kinase